MRAKLADNLHVYKVWGYARRVLYNIGVLHCVGPLSPHWVSGARSFTRHAVAS